MKINTNNYFCSCHIQCAKMTREGLGAFIMWMTSISTYVDREGQWVLNKQQHFCFMNVQDSSAQIDTARKRFKDPPSSPVTLRPLEVLIPVVLKSYKQLQLSYFCAYIQYDNIHRITAGSIVWLWEPFSILQLSNQRCWVDARIGCLGSTEDLPAGHSK